MSEFQADKIKVVLKTLLKNQKKSYEQLASHLSCSVPTVKRILGREEISLTRLLEILAYLDISLAEVETLTSNLKGEKLTFSTEQQQFLRDNPGHFAFFMYLAANKSDLDTIKQRFSLNDSSVRAYLLDLEKIGLVEATDLSVRIINDGMPDLTNTSLGSLIYERTITASGQFYTQWIHRREQQGTEAVTKEKRLSCTYSTMGMQLTPESYQQWQVEQAARLEELHRRAQFEEKSYPKDALIEVLVTDASAAVAIGDPLLAIFEDVWGKIPNIR